VGKTFSEGGKASALGGRRGEAPKKNRSLLRRRSWTSEMLGGKKGIICLLNGKQEEMKEKGLSIRVQGDKDSNMDSRG